MNIFKIVKGNSFTLHIHMQKTTFSQDKQSFEDMDATAISGLCVYLNTMFGNNVPLSINETVFTSNNEIQITFPGDLEEGIYGITVKGKYNGNDICSIERRIFRIVGRNCQAYIPIGMMEGEMGGMYNTQYWIELNSDNETSAGVNVYAKVEPRFIKYNGSEQYARISWSTESDGSNVTPTALYITHGNEVESLPVTQTEKVVTLKDVGKYQYKVSAVVNGNTYSADVEVVVGKNAWYGVSAVTSATEIDLSSLENDKSTLVDEHLVIMTTETEDTIWFVSEVPLRFIEANLETDLEQTIIDGLYYYHTVPLVAGENDFRIKNK